MIVIMVSTEGEPCSCGNKCGRAEIQYKTEHCSCIIMYFTERERVLTLAPSLWIFVYILI